MAIKKCRACGKEIGPSARRCPQNEAGRWKNTFLIILLIAVMFGLGCDHGILTANSMTELQKISKVRSICGNDGQQKIMEQDLRSQIISGVTKSYQIEKIFGKPCEQSVNRGMEQWEYFWAKKISAWNIHLMASGETHTLIIYFDQNGIVTNFVFKKL